MNIRYTLLVLSAFLFAAGAGCEKFKPDAPSAPLAPSVLSLDTIARVHWLGKKRLGTTAGAYYVTRLWQFSETGRLQSQTLDKLSFAPWLLWGGEAAVQNAPAVLLRPLLEDCVQEECYFEVRGATNQPEEFVFAIHLDETRAGLWRTNLVAMVASLAGVETMDILDGGRGWLLKRKAAPGRFELARIGEWTVLAVGQDKSILLSEVSERIRHPQAPGTDNSRNWLEADFNLPRLERTFDSLSNLTDDLPRVSISVAGDGGNVLTHAQLTFAQPLPSGLAPWSVPTNLIHEPLASFTAIRGTGHLLSSWNVWHDLQMDSSPDQIFFWGLAGNPYQTYVAAPVLEASNEVQRLTERLLAQGNPWLVSHGYVSFERLPGANGAMWGTMPSVRPFFESAGSDAGSMVFAGLLPDTAAGTNRLLPVGILQTLSRGTNLVAYDWEVTGARIEASLNIGQLVRLVLHRAQLPLDSAGANWLKAIMPRLGNSETAVIRAGANQLVLDRKSTVGLTGAELNLLADWLESPQFPRGLYSTLTRPEAPSAEAH